MPPFALARPAAPPDAVAGRRFGRAVRRQPSRNTGAFAAQDSA